MLTGEGNELRCGNSLSHYKIVELLGEGGMGKVYLADDINLHRKVALKVLPQHLADKFRLQRFEQEAQAASALNHPNILTIHEIGESDGAHFTVSEYVKGNTLRERIRDLTVTQSLDIAIQVASALRAAHEHGIVHRDIKPENVMVREDGLVKVLDFGIAKLTEKQNVTLDTEAKTLALVKTQPGMIMGTASYMSPEQARGQGVDQRTDIWSLGVVLFEMLAGHTPFNGETAMDLIASILDKEPQPLPSGAASSGVAKIVLRALQKSVGDRYQTSGEMLADLQSLKRRREANSIDERVPKDNRVTETLEPAVTSRVRRWSGSSGLRFAMVAVFTLLIIGAAVAYLISFRTTQIPQNSAAGTVRSRAYDDYMRGKVKASSDNREEIEGAIKLLEQAVAIDPNYAEAYAALALAYNTKSFQFAVDSDKKELNENAEIAVEKALALNPNLAEGHLARGVILWTHAKRFPHEQAIQSFKRAIGLNPNLDEAYHRLGMVYSHIGLIDQAREVVKKGVDINLNNTLARFRLGTFEAYQGKYNEAVGIYKTILSDVSPSLVDRNLADALVHLGRLDEASAIVEEYLKKYPQDEGGNITSVKAILLAKAGKQQEAEATIQRAIEIGQGFGHFHHTAYNIASAYAILNKPEEAVKWLEIAADDGFPCYTYFEIDHNLDNIRKDQRFIEFMKKLKVQWEKYKALV